MKKTLIIAAIIIAVGIIVVILFALRKSPSGTRGIGTTGLLPPVATSSPLTSPTGDTLTLGTPQGNVTVNNFYQNAQQVSIDHTAILIQQTSTYNITYYVPDSSFNILIVGTPFTTVRTQAETAFLQMLGISQADACKLNVKVGTPISVDPNYAGQNLGLSFCGSNSAFQSK